MSNFFLDFVSGLGRSINTGLPGESAQLKMAPRFRKPSGFDLTKRATAKQGAVLILLYPEGNKINSILIKRTSYDGHHSSQVSFPGGKKEDSDENLFITALRESEEEIGIDKTKVELVGAISNLYIPVSNFNVHPFVAKTMVKPALSLNEREVDFIIEFDLQQLISEGTREQRNIKLANGLEINTPCYNINGNIVWGATAMIMSELKALIKEV